MASTEDLIRGIVAQTDNLLSTDFEISSPRTIPEVGEVGFNQARTVDAVCLFVDMRGSTGITAEKQRSTAVRIYRAYLDNVAEIIHHYSGEIRGFAGDSFLALFSGNKNDADQAVRCAWMIQCAITYIVAPEVLKRCDAELSVGIGIDMGTILAARVGKPYVPSTQNLIWTSHAVNVASKFCSAARPAEIVVSERVWGAMTNSTKKSADGMPLGWAERHITVAGEAIKVYAERGVYLKTFKEMGLYKEGRLPEGKISALLDPQEIQELRTALKQYAPAAFGKRITELKAKLAGTTNSLDRLLIIERMLECYEFLGRVDSIADWPARSLVFEKVRILQTGNCHLQAQETLHEVLEKFRWGDADELATAFGSENMLTELITAVESQKFKWENDYWILHGAYRARGFIGDLDRAERARVDALNCAKSKAAFAVNEFCEKFEKSKAEPTVTAALIAAALSDLRR